jgi:hypothetical protein
LHGRFAYVVLSSWVESAVAAVAAAVFALRVSRIGNSFAGRYLSYGICLTPLALLLVVCIDSFYEILH